VTGSRETTDRNGMPQPDRVSFVGLWSLGLGENVGQICQSTSCVFFLAPSTSIYISKI
jgi:hypothetical protein